MADRRPSTIIGAIRKGGAFDVRARGRPDGRLTDVYHQLVQLTWPRLGAVFIVCFLAFNLAFAGLFALDPGGLAIPHDEVHVADYWRDFFFSVHTVATIGYGNVYPVSLYANVLVVVEITFGILFFALTTGIVFARFSRPTARILFSRIAVVAMMDGVPTLMLRAANQRHNLIFSTEVRVSVLRDERVGDMTLRRFHDLELERRSNPVFALTWTVIHRIDEHSPLREWAEAGRAPDDAEIIVVLSGMDESTGQIIHGRTAYLVDHIRWNARFVDIMTSDPDGRRTIDYSLFHEVSAA
jgi:inward rectifier potassium channel